MKINKMTASFGKLENESIAFHDGLNVVCAPNESGKSTWCAFIKSMLYGVDSSERAIEYMRSALDAMRAGMTPDIVLTETEGAMSALGELSGRTVREDVTNRIFQRFCVGK